MKSSTAQLYWKVMTVNKYTHMNLQAATQKNPSMSHHADIWMPKKTNAPIKPHSQGSVVSIFSVKRTKTKTGGK